MTALFADDAGSLEFVELPDSESLGRAIAERPEKTRMLRTSSEGLEARLELCQRMRAVAKWDRAGTRLITAILDMENKIRTAMENL